MSQRAARASLVCRAATIGFVVLAFADVAAQENSSRPTATPIPTVTTSPQVAASPSSKNETSPADTSATQEHAPSENGLRKTLGIVLKSLEFVGLVVGLIALVLALIHLIEIRLIHKVQAKQGMKLESHSRRLDDIFTTQSTHHIGQFPDYLATIADFIENATKKVDVLCDLPGYGSFSAPNEYLRYRQAIEKKIAAGVEVKMTCLDVEHRTPLIREQFAKPEKEWNDWKKENAKTIGEYIKAHGGEFTIDTMTLEEFVILLIENLRRLDPSFKGVAFSHTDEYIPLYFWLADDTRAVFAIPSFSERGTEHGFTTLDPHLISAFLDLRKRYQRGHS